MDGKKKVVNEEVENVEKELKHVEFEKKGTENVLFELRMELEGKKKEVERMKCKGRRIPAQFLASQKLAMNKKKYSPKKMNENSFLTRRSNSNSR